MVMSRSRLPYLGRAGLIAAAAALALAVPAQAVLAAPAHTGLSLTVGTTPARGTPHFAAVTKVTEQVRQLVQCGGTMYAVGTFSSIEQGSKTYTRNKAFSFSATAPYTVTSWAPDVNGKVNSIAFNGTGCHNAYLGGDFTVVNGQKAEHIVEVSTSTGKINYAFAKIANGQVETLVANHGHLLTGGYFTTINGSSADPYMASLDVTTGQNDGFLRLNVSGHISYPGVASNVTRVYNQQISHSGSLDLAEGDFTSAGGQKRQQLFMLNLASSPTATVTGWTSPEFDGSKGNINVKGGYPYQCAHSEPFYIRSAAWSPDDSTIYTAATGYHPWNLPTGSFPRSGLCDSAAAFPSTQTSVLAKWINYTGCYSLYSAAADASTAYFAGHEKWSEAPDGCKATIDPHAIAAPGIEGLSPSTGSLVFNPTRARGLGADDLLVTSAGLWIASDNFHGAQLCGGVANLAGICFLPY
jgi:hypothetical protein